MRPYINVRWLCAHESRREHHLIANHQTVERQMVSHELPAPWLDWRGLAKQRKIKTPLTKNFGVTGQLTQKVIDSHDISGFRKTLIAQT